MALDLQPLLTETTAYTRIGFALALAEVVLPIVSSNPEAQSLARAALDYGWGCDIRQPDAGTILYDYLENAADEPRLLMYEYDAPKNETPAWLTITTAITYTAWEAYRHGPNPDWPSAMIDVDGPGALPYLVDNYLQVPGADRAYPKRLLDYCLDRGSVHDPEVLGTPAHRMSIRDAAHLFSGN